MIRLSSSLIAILLLFSSSISAYKILVYSPKFGGSHVTFMGNIADTLVRAGHNVTVLLPEMSPNVKISGTKLANVITVPPVDEAVNFFQESKYLRDVWTSSFNMFAMLNVGSSFRTVFGSTCEHLNTHKALLEQLKAEKFDVAVAEVFDACAIGLIEVLKIPAHVITCSSSIMDSLALILGIPLFPSYVPATFSRSTDQMNYFERFINFVSIGVGKTAFNGIIDAETKIFRKFYGHNFIDLKDKIAQASFVLTNGEPLLDFPHPTIGKVVEIGGLGTPKKNPLDKYWQSVVEKRDKVILMSFGTNARSSDMPDEFKRNVLKTFAEFPEITFIWKYESDDLDLKDHSNVAISKWFPQNDLLHNPRTVAFITHGGMNSVIEAATRGIPMITIPLFAEQNRNAAMVRRAGIGITLNVADLADSEKICATISTVLRDTKYMENAKRLAKMIVKKPVSPEELLLKHVEFAAEFGQLPNLDPVGRKMPFYKLYMLDIFTPLFIVSLILLLSVLITLVRVVKRLGVRVKKVKTH